MVAPPRSEAVQTARVVIVGAGFAGLNAARVLGGDPAVAVTVLDRRNHHLFQPLLYQVATAGLSPADISAPIRSVLAGHANVDVQLAEVDRVDLEARIVYAGESEVPYDYLVLACGATHSYFGHDGWEEHAPGLKTLEQATEIRRRVLTAFELAELERDRERRRELLTFVVVGGGPTGVELAGALGELSRHTLYREFRHVDSRATRVILVEGGPRILSSFDPELSAAAQRDLERLGVTVWTDTRVTKVDAYGVQAGAERVQARTVLWAAGVRASPLNLVFGLQLDNAGRVTVTPDLSVPGRPEVFVIGDQARFEDEHGVVPGLAPAAIQQGKLTGRNILADVRGRAREPFVYFDKGTMATIGRARAVTEVGTIKLQGFVAWLAWCFVHILYLIGFRNRLLVFVQWLWSYVRFKRGARLILHRDWHSHEPDVPMSVLRRVESDSRVREAAP